MMLTCLISAALALHPNPIGSDIMTLAPSLTTLDALKAGQSATVIHLAPSLDHGGGADVSRRLMELGFVPGERIRMLKRGLPGGPVAVKVGQSTFALRRFEAALISIQPE
jgi:ferrous iron transport protein A